LYAFCDFYDVECEDFEFFDVESKFDEFCDVGFGFFDGFFVGFGYEWCFVDFASANEKLVAGEWCSDEVHDGSPIGGGWWLKGGRLDIVTYA
jgi:hypothetical protein